MGILSKASYAAEILLGGLIFLHSYPRRDKFPLRISLACAVTLLCGYWLAPLRMAGQMKSFLGFLITIAVMIASMCFVLACPLSAILPACVAGVAAQHIGYHLSRLVSLLPFVGQWSTPLEIVCVLLVYAVLFAAVGPLVRRERYYAYCDARVTAVSVVIILVCIGITRFIRLGGALNSYAVIATSLYAITCCLLALFIQFFIYYFVRVKSENLLLQRIRQEERRQYEASRENAELLSIKYHDLKHKLLSLEGQLPRSEIDSMRSIIDAYDRTYQTGLDALDIVLNEKNMHCHKRNISLTCMGHGGELSFMDTMDVYSLFGNILENAISEVEKIEPLEKRLISLVIERKGSFVYIDTVNFMSGLAPSFSNGLPETTKTDAWGYHGYGLKSVRAIAEKYHGDVVFSVDEDVFKVSIYMLDSSKSPCK